jgi:hypothetical protein
MLAWWLLCLATVMPAVAINSARYSLGRMSSFPRRLASLPKPSRFPVTTKIKIHAFPFFRAAEPVEQRDEGLLDDDDYVDDSKVLHSPLVDFNTLAAAVRGSLFAGKQDLKYEVLYPLIHKQVSAALSQEFSLIQRELAANLPDLPPLPVISLPKRSNKALKTTKFIVDTAIISTLNILIQANNAIRHLGLALRHSILMVLSDALSIDSVMPLVDSIAEAVVNNIDVNPIDLRLLFDQQEYKSRMFERLHSAIMKEFDSEDGLDQMLDNYATQFALAGSQAVQNFFIYALQSTPLSPRVIAKIHEGRRAPSTRPKRSRHMHSTVQSVPTTSLPHFVAKYAQSIGTTIAHLSVETLAALITGLTIAYSGFLKHIIRQSLALPPIRQRILAFFEFNILRGYMPIDRLPKAICKSNSHFTAENICDGAKTREERLRALEKRE